MGEDKSFKSAFGIKYCKILLLQGFGCKYICLLIMTFDMVFSVQYNALLIIKITLQRKTPSALLSADLK